MDKTPVQVCQLKVTLQGSRPPIWRRFQVPGNVTLYKLHRVLQVVMGWTDSHLHQFIVGEIYYQVPDPDDIPFGDCWRHDVLVEGVQEPKAGIKYPACLAGKRACPPEDCGGIWGYADFLRAISDPRHPEHGSMKEWVGGAFDPAVFDLEEVNAALRRMR